MKKADLKQIATSIAKAYQLGLRIGGLQIDEPLQERAQHLRNVGIEQFCIDFNCFTYLPMQLSKQDFESLIGRSFL